MAGFERAPANDWNAASARLEFLEFDSALRIGEHELLEDIACA
jgi:hypothetical protein